MPTYEFRCPDGHEFEKFYRKISDAKSELPCPVCGKVATRQVSGGAGLLFKGSGFYLTDYGKNAHRKPGPSGSTESKKGSESGASGETKSSDAKPSETKSGDAKPAAESTPAKQKPSSGNKSET